MDTLQRHSGPQTSTPFPCGEQPLKTPAFSPLIWPIIALVSYLEVGYRTLKVFLNTFIIYTGPSPCIDMHREF